MDAMLKKVIEHPITSHALLEMLIEDGVKINPMPTTFSERKTVLYKIIEELEKRDISSRTETQEKKWQKTMTC